MFSKVQNFLIPSFLQRFDFWLMTHKPHIWRTRGHFVVFYCSILAAMLYAAGKMYPQNFADYFDLDVYKNDSVMSYFTWFLCFTSMGIVMWWWYTIQKFGYRRTNIVHFLTEIGIYTLGIFAISMFIFGYERGYRYHQAYELDKNSREDSAWVFQNGCFQYGYMPHFQLNKENDFNLYFKRGEQLSGRMYARNNVVSGVLRQDPKFNPSTDYVGHDPFSLSLWEYPTTEKKYARPPQYLTPADYVNRILTNDTFWKQEEKRIGFKDFVNVSREYLTNMTQEEIINLIDEVYPRYFNKINYFNENQSEAKTLLKLSINKKLFLESLSEPEIKDYKAYLIWLKNNYALYAPKTIFQFEKNAGQGFTQKRNNRPFLIKDEKDEFLASIYIGTEDYFDDDKGELAGEKLEAFLEKLDLISFKMYLTYLQQYENYSDVKLNKNSPKYTESCRNYFKQYVPKSNLDSMYHYDYFVDNTITEFTWLNIIADEYAHFVTSKYTAWDYTKLRNILHTNSFEDVYPKSKNEMVQQLLQLHQVDDYLNATALMQQYRVQFETKKFLTFSFFALLYSLFFAIIFYISTQSSGIQFWISAFLGGFLTAFLLFMRQVFPSSFTSYPQFHRENDSISYYFSFGNWDSTIMYLFAFLMGLFILIFIFKKTQLPKIQIWFNTIVFGSLFGIYGAFNYCENKLQIIMSETMPDKPFLEQGERIQLYSLILLVAIIIYGLAAWLYKRHLTYPKKQ
jgi:hypothetical protein